MLVVRKAELKIEVERTPAGVGVEDRKTAVVVGGSSEDSRSVGLTGPALDSEDEAVSSTEDRGSGTISLVMDVNGVRDEGRGSLLMVAGEVTTATVERLGDRKETALLLGRVGGEDTDVEDGEII